MPAEIESTHPVSELKVPARPAQGAKAASPQKVVRAGTKTNGPKVSDAAAAAASVTTTVKPPAKGKPAVAAVIGDKPSNNDTDEKKPSVVASGKVVGAKSAKVAPKAKSIEVAKDVSIEHVAEESKTMETEETAVVVVVAAVVPKETRVVVRSLGQRAADMCIDLMKNQPAGNPPPCLWTFYYVAWMEKLRKNPAYFTNHDVDKYKFQLYISNLDGNVERACRIIRDGVVAADDEPVSEQKDYFLPVIGPPGLLVSCTGMFGTWGHKNSNLTKNVDDAEEPDHHQYRWTMRSKEFLPLARKVSHPLVNAEFARWMRYINAVEAAFFAAHIKSALLRTDCKPEDPKGKGVPKGTKSVKNSSYYKDVIWNLKKYFRVIVFDNFMRAQKASDAGMDTTKTDQVVKDMQDKLLDDVHTIKVGAAFRLDDDEGILDSAAATAAPTEADMTNAAARAAASGLIMTAAELDQYRTMRKEEEDVIEVLCSKLYVQYTNEIKDGSYDALTDPVRKTLTLPDEGVKPVAVDLNMFPHPDSGFAPKRYAPLIADTCSLFIANGQVTSRADVFKAKPKRMKDQAVWDKEYERRMKYSHEVHKSPALMWLAKKKKIIYNYIPTWAGCSDDFVDAQHAFDQPYDIQSHKYHLKCTLNGMVGKEGAKRDMFSLRIFTAGKRIFARPPAYYKRSLMDGVQRMTALGLDDDTFDAVRRMAMVEDENDDDFHADASSAMDMGTSDDAQEIERHAKEEKAAEELGLVHEGMQVAHMVALWEKGELPPLETITASNFELLKKDYPVMMLTQEADAVKMLKEATDEARKTVVKKPTADGATAANAAAPTVEFNNEDQYSAEAAGIDPSVLAEMEVM